MCGFAKMFRNQLITQVKATLEQCCKIFYCLSLTKHIHIQHDTQLSAGARILLAAPHLHVNEHHVTQLGIITNATHLVGVISTARIVCSCTCLSVCQCTSTESARSQPLNLYNAWFPLLTCRQCCHSWILFWVFSLAGVFRCLWVSGYFLSVTWVFHLLPTRENSAVAVQFIVDSVQGHPRSLISIPIESAFKTS